MKEDKCLHCSCYDSVYGCTMPSVDKEYACSLNYDDGDYADYYNDDDDDDVNN